MMGESKEDKSIDEIKDQIIDEYKHSGPKRTFDSFIVDQIITDEMLPKAGQQYEYKGTKYYILKGKVNSKHPDTGEWYISVQYCISDMIFNREARDFLKKFKLVTSEINIQGHEVKVVVVKDHTSFDQTNGE